MLDPLPHGGAAVSRHKHTLEVAAAAQPLARPRSALLSVCSPAVAAHDDDGSGGDEGGGVEEGEEGLIRALPLEVSDEKSSHFKLLAFWLLSVVGVGEREEKGQGGLVRAKYAGVASTLELDRASQTAALLDHCAASCARQCTR